MGNLLVGCLLIFAGLNCFAQRSVNDLNGTWQSEDGTTGTIQFIDESHVQGNINGLQIPPTSYKIDFSHTPIWFDIYLQGSKPVPGLLEFLDDDTVKLQILLSGERAIEFNETELNTNPILILKRKK